MGEVRGQVSMEYLLIATFAFLLLAPIVIIAYSQSASFNSDVSATQIQKVAAQLQDAIDTAYFAGPPTRKTIKVHMPHNVNDISIGTGGIVFTVQGRGGTYEYAVSTSANLTGSIRTFQGVHTITVEALDDSVLITDS